MPAGPRPSGRRTAPFFIGAWSILLEASRTETEIAIENAKYRVKIPARSVSTTRYRSLRRRQALLVLALLVLAVGVCLFLSVGPPPKLGGPVGVQGDVALYTAVVERLHAGEDYYDVMGVELQSRGFPVSSVFNWRTPLHLELIAHLPALDGARALLLAVAICAIGLSAASACRDGLYALAYLQSVLLGCSFVTVYPFVLFGEVWAGVCITLSVASYAFGWRYAGVSAGVAALFFRELALPYAFIAAFLAYREHRRSELLIWLAGIGGWAIYLGLHASAVLSRVPPSVAALGVDRWIQFGGMRFILSTSRMGLLLGLPFWLAALYLPLAVLGLAGWKNPVAPSVGATVVAYLLAFGVVGAPSMNYYWGGIYSPLLAFGAAWAMPACRDLARAAGLLGWIRLKWARLRAA